MRSLVFLLLLLAPAAGGQDVTPETVRALKRFELFNACRPMRILISNRSPAAADIGLTSEALQAAAESRLRAVRSCSWEWA